MTWFIDGNNVMGSRPDGWWKDRRAAQRRLARDVERWAATTDHIVVLVFDGSPAGEPLANHERVVVRFAGRGRDAADHLIVELVAERGDEAPVTVVTSDRGLRHRLPANVDVLGARMFLDRLAVGEARPPGG